MVTSIGPLAIFLGAAAAAALAFYAFWGQLQGGVASEFKRFEFVLDRAGIKNKPEDLVIIWTIITAAVWVLALILLKPSIAVGILLIPIAAVVGGGIFAGSVHFKLRQRTEAFLNQFEMVLRLMASGMRSGLGLQQALRLVTEESQDPSRYEFARVLGQTNIGVSVHDALDDMARRVQANETLMMARVIRINSQTGGDMARVLEQLANTIKERRRMRRKIQSLTAEGRAGAVVLAALPIFLGGFIILTQPTMSHGLLYTQPGHIVALIIVLLEAGGIFALNRILKVNV